jgi:electron transfer flavoprotein beta subunit
MKIIVLVKVVPDTWGDRLLSLDTGLALRDASDYVLDEICERALELALRHAEANPGTEIVALCMGPTEVAPSLRRVLALGADSVLHVVDDTLSGSDLGTTADVLAAAIRYAGFDLVISGNQSTDGSGGVLPAMIAEHLNLPHATALQSVTITTESVVGSRASDRGIAEVYAELPAVVSITEASPDPRVPNFKGIMAAKKKPIETISLTELELNVDVSGTPRSIVLAVAERPPRTTGVKIVDEGDAGTQLAEFLIQKRLV